MRRAGDANRIVTNSCDLTRTGSRPDPARLHHSALVEPRADADIGRLLGAVERAGARVVVVGDYHQLDPVGPGGALEAITARHPDTVHALGDNLRQIDPAERAALDQLRAGSVDAAVGWYGRHGRIHPAATRARAVYDMVNAWAADVASGKESLLLAYRRDSVAALNHTARQAWRALGRLDGAELHAGDGRVFQAGDRVITLTPGPDGAWTTSQRATITAIDPDQRTLTAVTPEGTKLHISGEYLAGDHIGYGYAITVHRSQGATVDTAHVLADGGGRELGYVAMSRARGESHVHAIAASQEQAAGRLAWEWQHSRRQTWTPQVVVDPS
ncbi:MAG TPA: AAA family ATPase, partial [Acidimicrobiales bacterium]|nr:AAA family ATPase [Acidimicrobiales bacterium]